MGLGGNIYEWEETTFNLLNNSPLATRGVRGGNWDYIPNDLSSSIRYFDNPTLKFALVGFRVASVPEPSSAALLMLATVALWQLRKRSS
jgi:formylglycine-generating enzyme required for sulfatase activity